MITENNEFIGMTEEELDEAAGGRRIVRVVGSPYGVGAMPGYGYPPAYPSPYVAPAPLLAPPPVLSPYAAYGAYGYGPRFRTAL